MQFDEYQGATHITAGAFFDPKTGPFLQQRFAGVPFHGNCASIGRGDSLAPLPMSESKPASRAGRTSRNEQSGSPTARGNPSLATTGLLPLLPLAGAGLVLAAMVTGRARRRSPWLRQRT